MNKKLLLVCPEFYGYHISIESAFKAKYDTTTVLVKYTDIKLSDKSFKSSFLNLFSFIGNIRSNIKRNQDYIELENKLLSTSFDLVVIITLYPFSEDFLRRLKSKNNKINIILYLWDDISVVPNVLQIVKDIDIAYTFNHPDIKELKQYALNGGSNVKYLPLFYIKSNEIKTIDKYKISYIGTVNPDTVERLTILNKLENWSSKFNVKRFFYLRYHKSILSASILRQLLWKCIKPELYNYYISVKNQLKSEGYLHSESLTLETVSHIQEESECLVDFSHQDRQGYCANLISAIGNGKKLITNNKFIANEPFYNKYNICIIDDDLNHLDCEFLNVPKHKIDLSCLEINNWIRMLTEDVYYDEHIQKVAPSAFITK